MEPSDRPAHPLAADLIDRLRREEGNRVVEIGGGSGRNTRALQAAGLRVIVIPDGQPFPPLGPGVFDGALSTHALLHGSPETIARLVALIARSLKPGAPLYATLGSTRDARFGVGTAIGPWTFAPSGGDEAGVAHTFFDRERLLAMLEEHFTIESLAERDVDDIAGRWAHERKPLRGSAHWFVKARKP